MTEETNHAGNKNLKVIRFKGATFGNVMFVLFFSPLSGKKRIYLYRCLLIYLIKGFEAF